MKTKKEIVKDWITRYTGVEISDFGEYILLTNFQKYVDEFASLNNVSVNGKDKNMPSSTHNNITIINFGMGSPNAATVMDLLTALMPKAVLFLGVNPGFSNQDQSVDLIKKIKDFKSNYSYSGLIIADGGIKNSHLQSLENIGVDIAVQGGAIFG